MSLIRYERHHPERPALGVLGLLLCALTIWGAVSMFPDMRRYLRIKRM